MEHGHVIVNRLSKNSKQKKRDCLAQRSRQCAGNEKPQQNGGYRRINATREGRQQGRSPLPAAGGRNVRVHRRNAPPPPPPPRHHQRWPLPQRHMADGHTHAGTADLKLRASQEFQTEQSGIEDYIYRGGNAEGGGGRGGGRHLQRSSWSHVCCSKFNFHRC